MAAVTTIVLAGIAVAGAAYSGYSSYKQAKAQKKASKVEQKMANEQAARSRREEIRRARIARAQSINYGEQVGAGGSSGLLGGIGGIGSQMGSNVGYSLYTQGLGNKRFGYLQNAATWGSRGAIAGGVSSLATTAFTGMGGWDKVNQWMNPPGIDPMGGPLAGRKP